jgi:hypothetical protein
MTQEEYYQASLLELRRIRKLLQGMYVNDSEMQKAVGKDD